VQAIRAATCETLEFGEGCIYPILHRLEDQKLLSASQDVVGGRTRFVYRVTTKGKAQLSESVSAWQRVVDSVNHALQGGDRGRAAVA
jgi:PadR family transcriptional regulator PadR